MKKLDSKLQKEQQGRLKSQTQQENTTKMKIWKIKTANFKCTTKMKISEVQLYARAHSGPRLAN